MVTKTSTPRKRTRQKTSARDPEVFRKRILEARADLVSQYQRDLKQGLETQEEASQDLVDRANTAYSREFLFSLSGSQRETLLQIEDAMQRLEEGTYFNCAHCDTPIAPARLEAVPWTRYCIDCQELKEQGLLEEE
ncbi:MAG: TraR/DksA family transcriptional regulator [Thermoanaerobaculia bacterium]